jgi:hypothetical protein
MPNEEKRSAPTGAQPARGQDDEAALERELGREAAEGSDAIGDMRENRNLSGSSTWDTIDSQRASDGGDRPEVF